MIPSPVTFQLTWTRLDRKSHSESVGLSTGLRRVEHLLGTDPPVDPFRFQPTDRERLEHQVVLFFYLLLT